MNQDAKTQWAHDRKMKNMRTTMWILIAFAILISLFIFIKTLPPPTGKYDSFAKCIANTSTTFYGAFWCPHCQNQKRSFGTAERYLPYVECSLPDQSGQTQACNDAKIETYPTWQFPDKSRLSGEISLEDLAKNTGCPLPTST